MTSLIKHFPFYPAHHKHPYNTNESTNSDNLCSTLKLWLWIVSYSDVSGKKNEVLSTKTESWQFASLHFSTYNTVCLRHAFTTKPQMKQVGRCFSASKIYSYHVTNAKKSYPRSWWEGHWNRVKSSEMGLSIYILKNFFVLDEKQFQVGLC